VYSFTFSWQIGGYSKLTFTPEAQAALISVNAEAMGADPSAITIVSIIDITFPYSPPVGRRLLDDLATTGILTGLNAAFNSPAERDAASSQYQGGLNFPPSVAKLIANLKAETASLPSTQQPQEPIIPGDVTSSSPPPQPGDCKAGMFQYFVNNCASGDQDPSCQIFVGQFEMNAVNFQWSLTSAYLGQPVKNRFILVCARCA
jgi:hypothetical protein